MKSNEIYYKPQPIELYASGFEDFCNLGRAAEGKKLSRIVESVDDPLVVAVDAPWGAGKTHFLQCWAGAHENENGGQARTVYFDAFKHDYLDDPLTSIFGEIAARLGLEEEQTGFWGKAKHSLYALRAPALRAGVAVATSGLSELTGPMLDEVWKTSSEEFSEQTKEYFEREKAKRVAMSAFREALTGFAEMRKLVIIVDELDRCRPDYALNLLEVVKHFFDVPGVHFILGVNVKELANCVRARYGAQSQAERYLQKFIHLSFPLRKMQVDHPQDSLRVQHFKNVSSRLGLDDRDISHFLRCYLSATSRHFEISLRDIERIATSALVTVPPKRYPRAAMHLYSVALILEVVAPEFARKARFGELTIVDFSKIFSDRLLDEFTCEFSVAKEIWKAVTFERGANPQYAGYGEILRVWFDHQKPADVLSDVISNTLDEFSF